MRYTFPMATSELALPIDMPMDDMAAFCERWQIVEFALFGSVLRDDFGPESDVDVLVRFAPEHRVNLLDYPVMEDELSELLERSVQVVNRSSIERSENWIRRENILGSARMVYAAA